MQQSHSTEPSKHTTKQRTKKSAEAMQGVRGNCKRSSVPEHSPEPAVVTATRAANGKRAPEQRSQAAKTGWAKRRAKTTDPTLVQQEADGKVGKDATLPACANEYWFSSGIPAACALGLWPLAFSHERIPLMGIKGRCMRTTPLITRLRLFLPTAQHGKHMA